MKSDELRAVSAREHQPRLNRAKKAHVADSPEYAALLARQTSTLAMASSKEEMAAATKVQVGAQTSLGATQKVVQRLEAAQQEAKRAGTESAPEFAPCAKRLEFIRPIQRLKLECHTAAQGGSPAMEIDELRGKVVDRMERARVAAQKGGAYGGDVARALERRLILVEQMASGKMMAKHALLAIVSARVSVPQLKSEAEALATTKAKCLQLSAEGSSEVTALASLIDELHKAAEAKRSAQDVIAAAQQLLEARLSKGAKVAFVGQKVSDCRRGKILNEGDPLVVQPINWWGTALTTKQPDGTSAEGKELFKEVPLEVKVGASVCIVTTPEGLDAQLKQLEQALQSVTSIVAKGKLAGGGGMHEADELRELQTKYARGCEPSSRVSKAGAKRSQTETRAWEQFQQAQRSAAERAQHEEAKEQRRMEEKQQRMESELQRLQAMDKERAELEAKERAMEVEMAAERARVKVELEEMTHTFEAAMERSRIDQAEAAKLAAELERAKLERAESQVLLVHLADATAPMNFTAHLRDVVTKLQLQVDSLIAGAAVRVTSEARPFNGAMGVIVGRGRQLVVDDLSSDRELTWEVKLEDGGVYQLEEHELLPAQGGAAGEVRQVPIPLLLSLLLSLSLASVAAAG